MSKSLQPLFTEEQIKASLKQFEDTLGEKIVKVQPLVSVIMPVFNCKRYVSIAIESVRLQSYRAIELIIVDDASEDGTTELLQKIIDVRNPDIKVIYRLKNGGTGAALNDGIKAAKGEYIHWLSADDVMYPDCVRDMMLFGAEDHYQKRKDTIFYSDYDIIDERGSFIGEFIEPNRDANDLEIKVKELWSHFYGNGSTTLIHRNVFRKCGLFDDNLKHSEDYEFWLRATQLFHVDMIRVPIKTIKYRNHPDQLTNKIGGSLDRTIKESIKRRMTELTV